MFENGFLHGDCMTVTGKTIEENLENISPSRLPAAPRARSRASRAGTACIAEQRRRRQSSLVVVVGRGA